MKVVLFACVVLAVCQIALAAEEGASLPKWIRPENKAWPAWGSIHMRWLQREAAEANRDLQDARAELAVVKSWAASYVRHRSDEVTVRVRNRNHECASFNRLVQIRKHNFLYHNTVHQRIAHFHKVRTMGDSLRRRLIQKHGPQKGAELYKTRYRARYEKWLAKREAYYQQKFNSKYSEHARMLLTSKDRFLSAQKAYNNCRITVARLLKHRLDVVNVAKKTGDAAVLRSQKHVNSTAARFKKVVLKIKKLRAAMIQRFKQSKIHFFHRCRRVGAYKYKCFFSVMHGGKQYRRQPFRFHKCIWAGATTAVVRYVCYK